MVINSSKTSRTSLAFDDGKSLVSVSCCQTGGGIEKINLQVREIEVLVAEIFHLILTLCSSYDNQQSDCRNEQSD